MVQYCWNLRIVCINYDFRYQTSYSTFNSINNIKTFRSVKPDECILINDGSKNIDAQCFCVPDLACVVIAFVVINLYAQLLILRLSSQLLLKRASIIRCKLLFYLNTKQLLPVILSWMLVIASKLQNASIIASN